MKKLLFTLLVVFVSLNFVACAEKKDNKSRLTRGAGRSNEVAGTPVANGWQGLNSSGAEETELRSNNPDQVARSFMRTDEVFINTVQINSVQLKLVFRGNQIDSSASKVGFRFYDNYSNPYRYFMGTEANDVMQGTRNGNQIDVVIMDIDGDGDNIGNVRIQGTVNGYGLSGTVTYDDGKQMGSFQSNRAIFN